MESYAATERNEGTFVYQYGNTFKTHFKWKMYNVEFYVNVLPFV